MCVPESLSLSLSDKGYVGDAIIAFIDLQNDYIYIDYSFVKYNLFFSRSQDANHSFVNDSILT